MEMGLSNLAFPWLNLSNMRSCDREAVDLEGKEQKVELRINNILIIIINEMNNVWDISTGNAGTWMSVCNLLCISNNDYPQNQ